MTETSTSINQDKKSKRDSEQAKVNKNKRNKTANRKAIEIN